MLIPERGLLGMLRHYTKTLTYCTLYIVLSGGLINFNKFLMHKGRFPHPMALTAIHMFTNLVLTGRGPRLIVNVKPSLMPGVEKCKGRLMDLYKYLVPIGCFFAVMLYGSNRAYMYCSVAFLQFMKEANVVLVFIFSALAGLQIVNRQRLFVICWVILGSSMCVSGELHFVFIGFAIQGVSQLAECMRAVIAELVLTGSGFRLDPLSYTFFVAPVCLAVLAVGTIVTWDPAIPADIATWWPCLIPNACIAVCLNVAIASVIQETSAVGFVITGMVKDIALVCFSSVFFHETITHMQWLAFMVTLSGVFFWSYMKIAPESRESPRPEAERDAGVQSREEVPTC
ncbi:unnamed protein product [Prorocentrum cordatum]|uniref:Sugar phosphate transporter domain-containing protein n=1 Tax=Prorocentrum cordatum TaxID=2364126 RepID=A0ABN9V595_9DINO|nr:unnamed protein product [Polarella glacialis]